MKNVSTNGLTVEWHGSSLIFTCRYWRLKRLSTVSAVSNFGELGLYGLVTMRTVIEWKGWQTAFKKGIWRIDL